MLKEKMIYQEFKTAAKKHYFTCKCLYNHCNNNWQIRENIVYLCGYVIEMMIKYRIFKMINYPYKEDIKNVNNFGITSEIITGRRGHNIKILSQKLRQFESSLLIDEILEYFERWDVSIRYNGIKDKYNDYNLDKLIEICEKVIQKFGG
jgi:hypothetical protein